MTFLTLSFLVPLAIALAAGYVGARLNSYFRSREVEKAEARELRSLLFLVQMEIGFNAWKLFAVKDGPPSNVIPHLLTDAWSDSQVRLAQLLSIEHLNILAPYYECIRMLKNMDITGTDDPGQITDEELELIMTARYWGSKASDMTNEYVNDPKYENPEDILERIKQRKSDQNEGENV